MKFAAFEFIDEDTCEIGESSWIVGEDPESFDNDVWVANREIIVNWPKEYQKVLKSSIDINRVETKSCAAKVIKFGDDLMKIREFLKLYLQTGKTCTPKHGRGKRTLKKPQKYQTMSEPEEASCEKTIKRHKKPNKTSTFQDDDLLEVKKKHGICQTKDLDVCSVTEFNERKKFSGEQSKHEDFTIKRPKKFRRTNPFDDDDLFELPTKTKNWLSDSDNDIKSDDEKMSMLEDENKRLNSENCILKNTIKKNEAKIVHLEEVIKSMKDIHEVALCLKKHMKNLNQNQASQVLPHRSETNPQSESSTSSPIRDESSSDDGQSVKTKDFVTITDGLDVTKQQYSLLKTKTTTKEWVYSVMAMLWDRETLATHSISGKASNAHKEKEAKPKLDPIKVNGICEYGARRFGCKKEEIKRIMTSKVNNVTKVLNAQKRFSKYDGQ